MDAPDRASEAPARTSGWRGPILALALYAAAVVVATFPAVLTFRTALIGQLEDPLVHLWTLRWYKACLVEGRSPFFCPKIQYPIGAPLGYLPPMHLQALLYLPLSTVLGDVACYNALWFFGFLFTGMGTFVLARRIVRDDRAAFLAGLLAMLGGPMTFFAHGQLEQITLGSLPLFLAAWLPAVDRPRWRNLPLVAAAYLLLVMSAPYFAVMGMVPAAWYVLLRWLGAGRGRRWSWVRARIGWMAAFAAIVGPATILLFGSQVWAIRHGFSMARDSGDYVRFGASFWGYLLPSVRHRLSAFLPGFYAVPELLTKVPSYLGVVTIGLVGVAAVRRPRFARAGFWWSALGVMVLLSLGAYWTVGSTQIPLPGLWLQRYCPLFKPLRSPAKFNLFAGVCAAILAGVGADALLARRETPGRKLRLTGLLTIVAVADLANVPFETFPLPPIPRCYAIIQAWDPKPTFIDVPLSNWAYRTPALCTYWQSIHRAATASGYTALPNAWHDERVVDGSPFDARRLMQPIYLANPENESFGLIRDVDFRSYAWLHLKVNDLRYIVLHRDWYDPSYPVYLDRLKAQLADAALTEDDRTIVYDRERLPTPTRPVAVCLDGWRRRVVRDDALATVMAREATVLVFNPHPNTPLALGLEAAAHRRARSVTLRDGAEVLARWTIAPGAARWSFAPAFRLPAGVRVLTIASDGDDPPASPNHAPSEGDLRPFSLWATAVSVQTAPEIFARRLDAEARAR